MNNNTKVVMGTLGAALAGAAAGILLAPKKGAETRNMIKTKANDLSSNAKQTIDKNYEKGKKTINDLTDKVKSSFKSNGSDQNNGTDFQKNERYVASTSTAASSENTSSKPGTYSSNPGTATKSKSTYPSDNTNRKFDDTSM